MMTMTLKRQNKKIAGCFQYYKKSELLGTIFNLYDIPKRFKCSDLKSD